MVRGLKKFNQEATQGYAVGCFFHKHWGIQGLLALIQSQLRFGLNLELFGGNLLEYSISSPKLNVPDIYNQKL